VTTTSCRFHRSGRRCARRFLWFFSFLPIFVLWVSSSRAGGLQEKTGELPEILKSSRPQNRGNLSLTFNIDRLNESAGYVILYQLSGDYAVHPRIRLGAKIPIWTVRDNFFPTNTDIGDFSMSVMGLVWGSASRQMALTLGNEFYFPTGDDKKNLGAGHFAFLPSLSLAKAFHYFDFLLKAGIVLEAGEFVNPVLNYEAGGSIPLLRGAIPLSLILSLQGFSYWASDTFLDGSTQLFLMSGLKFDWTPRWSTVLAGRALLFETLSFKPGLSDSELAIGRLSDVRASFLINLLYAF